MIPQVKCPRCWGDTILHRRCDDEGSVLLRECPKCGLRLEEVKMGGYAESSGPGLAPAEVERMLKNSLPKVVPFPDDGVLRKGPLQVSDPWAHRSTGMRCRTCMYFVPKAGEPNPDNGALGRCRRHAPTMSGFPAVYEADWCGDHKLLKA